MRARFSPAERAPARWLAVVAGCALACASLSACLEGTLPERADRLAEAIRVDSLRLDPPDRKYAPAGAPLALRFVGYHTGYLCARLLSLGADTVPGPAGLSLRARGQGQLPGYPACAVDSPGGRDTALPYTFAAFAAGGGRSRLRLLNSLGEATDSAWIVAGAALRDSLRFRAGDTLRASGLSVAFRDTAGGRSPAFLLRLPACDSVDYALAPRPLRDTLLLILGRVRFPSACGEAGDTAYADSIPFNPAFLDSALAHPGG